MGGRGVGVSVGNGVGELVVVEVRVEILIGVEVFVDSCGVSAGGDVSVDLQPANKRSNRNAVQRVKVLAAGILSLIFLYMISSFTRVCFGYTVYPVKNSGIATHSSSQAS